MVQRTSRGSPPSRWSRRSSRGPTGTSRSRRRRRRATGCSRGSRCTRRSGTCNVHKRRDATRGPTMQRSAPRAVRAATRSGEFGSRWYEKDCTSIARAKGSTKCSSNHHDCPRLSAGVTDKQRAFGLGVCSHTCTVLPVTGRLASAAKSASLNCIATCRCARHSRREGAWKERRAPAGGREVVCVCVWV